MTEKSSVHRSALPRTTQGGWGAVVWSPTVTQLLLCHIREVQTRCLSAAARVVGPWDPSCVACEGRDAFWHLLMGKKSRAGGRAALEKKAVCLSATPPTPQNTHTQPPHFLLCYPLSNASASASLKMHSTHVPIPAVVLQPECGTYSGAAKEKRGEKRERRRGGLICAVGRGFRRKHCGRSWQTVLYYSREWNELECNACEKSLILLGRQEIVKSSACAKTLLRSTES